MADACQTIRSRRVVLPGGMRPATVQFSNGQINYVGSYELEAGQDFGNWVIMPGIIDTHVHINEPGRTDWEGFETATKAAAAGGVTTLIDMPLNCIPATVCTQALQCKLAAAKGKCWVDIGFWGGVIPGNASEVLPLWEAGCCGFKCFMAPSGVDEFPSVTESDLRQAMLEIAAWGGVLLAHAEDPTSLLAGSGDPRQYASYLASRPPCAEDSAIELLLRLGGETRCRVHIVHLSSTSSLPQLTAARASGLPITVETCPHYLSFAAEEIGSGATEFKCAPPIRESANRDGLWQALASGAIDFVVSDHSPCPPSLKRKESGDFFQAWGGISSLELGLAAVWTEARGRLHSIEDIARWMSAGPASLAGLGKRKGSIAPGYDADFAVWDPEADFTVDTRCLRQQHKFTPYAGRQLFGVVHRTFLRGKLIDPDGPATGRILRRHHA